MQMPAKLTIFVLCKTKSKREPPCELMHTVPKIVFRDGSSLPGVSDEPWWKALTSVAGLKKIGSRIGMQAKQLIASLHISSASDLKGALPTADSIKAGTKWVAATVKDLFASVAKMKLPKGAGGSYARLVHTAQRFSA